MSLSIYTSLYNAERMRFDYRGAFRNWLAFLRDGGQLVIAINTSEDDSLKRVTDWAAQWRRENPASGTRIDIVETAVPYDDPTFDGQIKAAALAKCTERFAILLDLDERLSPRQYRQWLALATELERSPYDAFMIPVVDLIGDERFFKSIGTKPYLHKNRPELTRGVRKEARLPDGSVDTDLSDTTEIVTKETGGLARLGYILAPNMPAYITLGQLEGGDVPFVTHLGWLDYEQRLRQADFWKDVWTARRGGKNPEPKLTLEALEKMPRFRHHLPSWKDGTL